MIEIACKLQFLQIEACEKNANLQQILIHFFCNTANETENDIYWINSWCAVVKSKTSISFSLVVLFLRINCLRQPISFVLSDQIPFPLKFFAMSNTALFLISYTLFSICLSFLLILTFWNIKRSKFGHFVMCGLVKQQYDVLISLRRNSTPTPWWKCSDAQHEGYREGIWVWRKWLGGKCPFQKFALNRCDSKSPR